jgi:hypothetical protein
MDNAINVIKALLAVLNAENTTFNELNRVGVTNVAGIIQTAEQFVVKTETLVEEDTDDSPVPE